MTKKLILSLFIIIPIGFYSKLYQGPFSWWVNNSLGGVFYEIFWCLFLGLFVRPIPAGKIAIFVLAGTVFLEFLQLWHPPFLEIVRQYFIGRAVLGTSFTWTDIPYYFLGSALGWQWLLFLKQRSE